MKLNKLFTSLAATATVLSLINPTAAVASDPVCTITVNDSNITVQGTNGNDVICINGSNVGILGFAGSDTVMDRGANNTVDLGTGNDTYIGTTAATSTVIGGLGNDTITGSNTSDSLSGGDGDDTLVGGSGADTLDGNSGDDTIFAGNSDDTISGGLGDDSISGEAGSDAINGDEGIDIITGGPDNDRLFGGSGADTLRGGDGTNLCDFDSGDVQNDTCTYDFVGPEVSLISISPMSSIDSSSSNRDIEFVFSVAPDPSGISWFGVVCNFFQVSISPENGGQITGAKSLSNVGNVYTAISEVPLNLKPGKLSCYAFAYDYLRNASGSSWTDGPDIIRTIDPGIDETPPQLINFSASQNTIDSSVVGNSIEVSIQARDDSEIYSLDFICHNSFEPNRYFIQQNFSGLNTLNLNFSMTIEIPIGLHPGDVSCNVRLIDKFNNQVLHTGMSLFSVTRSGTGWDDVGPTLTKFNLSKTSLETYGTLEERSLDLEIEMTDQTDISDILLQCGAFIVSLKTSRPGDLVVPESSWDYGVFGHSSFGGLIETPIAEVFGTYTKTVRVAIPYGWPVGNYSCAVQSHDTLGHESWVWNAKTFAVVQTAPRIPTAPTSLSYSPTTGRPSDGVIRWTAPNDLGYRRLTDYEIQWSKDKKTWTTLNDGIGTSTSASIYGLSGGTTYYLRVRGDNSLNNVSGQTPAPWSNILTITTPAAVTPAAASNLTVSNVTSSTSSLSWTTPYNGGSALSDYKVEISSNGGSTWTAVTHTASTSSTFNLSKLNPGTTYQVRVSAKNKVGFGAAVSSSFTTLGAAPTAVQKLKTSSYTASSVLLSWNAPATPGGTITDHKIEFSSNNGVTWNVIAHEPTVLLGFNVTGLQANKAYQFRVSAINGNGTGAVSAVLKVTTKKS